MQNDAAEHAPATSEREGRTTRDEWLALAIAALIADGIDRVKVQIIAKTLGVSRSSFYFFFESTKDLHAQMLDFWLRKNTGPIIERAMRPSDTITRGILNVFECWLDLSLFDPQLDIAVRLWARRSATVAAVVAQADEQRLGALSRLFTQHGYEAEDAMIRARVLYFTQIGHYTLDLREDVKVRFQNAAGYVRAFSGRDASKAEMESFRRFARRFRSDI